MDSEYDQYDIEVTKAQSWMDRPIKVELRTRTPNGYNATVFYLDETERLELILALKEYHA